MSAILPDSLKNAAQDLLVGYSRKQLAARAGRISDHYREGGASAEVVRNPDDVTAYLFSRLPGTFGATAAALMQTSEAYPAFSPLSLLDVGAGPGTASWAAAQTWPDLSTITMLDSNPSFLDVAGKLTKATQHPGLRSSKKVLSDMVKPQSPWPQADLVIASFALAEIPESDRLGVLDMMWASTKNVMLIVEPGTTAGYLRILEIRNRILAQAGHILAPCPHSLACPIVSPDWCHFVQRVQRTKDHMIAKNATVPYEDEKFAYIAFAREKPAPRPAHLRILLHPNSSKAGLHMKVCSQEGIKEITIGKREKKRYAIARRLGWGDALVEKVQETSEPENG